MPPARAARRVPAPTTPAARVRAPAPAQPAHRPSRGEPLSAAGPAVRLTPAKTARPTAVPAIGGGGDPLPGPVRLQLEKSLRVDLRAVRVHTDAHAHELAKSLSARAVTYGNHIFLGEGEQPTDIALVGHEVAHVVQQRAAPRLQAWNRSHTDSYEREAHQTADAVARRQQFTVHERTTGPRAQRLGISDVLDYFADKANIIPGFRMFTIILGVNPINMSSVDRSAANILRALIEFIPGGGLVTQALDNYGIFDKIGAWIEQQVAALGMVGSSFRQAIDDFLDSLSWTDIFHLGDVWDRAKRIFTAPIDRLISFAKGVITDILKFIKEAILKPLAALAEGTPAYDLLKAVLGEDPITGEPVAQDADALIGGFMKLVGQEEIYNNIKKANALSRAWAWFKGALSGLLGFVRQIPGLFIAALQSLELFDVVLPPRAFVKIARVFAGFFGQFVSWAGGQILSLLQIIFEVVAPGAVPYVKKAAGAFKTIIQNPIGFIGNLVKAGKQGFQQFASRFLTHLKKSLIDWLTGTLSGADLYIPQSFEFLELLKFVLSVLGLTWQNIRQKLVKAIGETAVKALETGFEIVVTLVTKGPAAAWQQIKEGLTNLKEMAMDAIMDYVKSKVVEEAVKKLISFLSPVGAFIQAIIAIYNTIMFFVERLKQIARVAMAFIDSIAAIAVGAIGAAANKVEQTMAGFLTLVISFLARFAGLGKVSDAVVKLLNKIRAPIDKALDKVVAWVVSMAKKLGRIVAQAGVPADPAKRFQMGMDAALAVVNRFSGKTVGKVVIVPLLAGVKVRYGFTMLELVPEGGIWWVDAEINPRKKQPSKHVKVGTGADNYPVGLLKMPLTVVTFFVKGPKGKKPGLDKDEFDRQLTIQKNAINAMPLQTWIGNRNKFDKGGRESKGDNDIKVLKAAFEEQLNGGRVPPKPSSPDPRVQELYKLVLLAQSELERMQNEIIAAKPELAQPANAARLRAAVKKMFKASAGLHRVDQYAGGSGTDIAGLGGEREDYSIGAAWAQASKVYRSRAETIHKFIVDKMDKSVWPTENMNVDLVSQAK
jgi:hypothetical protein